MGVSECPHCGSIELASNEAGGEKLCTGCGSVLEQGVMVESVSFDSNAGVVGQYVSFNAGGAGSGRGGSRESREQVMQRGRANIQRVAEQLKLPAAHQDAAHRVFMLAVQRNFTMGRPGLHVAAVCLYTVCRRQKTPHLLIDFSDLLRVPVKTLGRVFVKMARLLHIPIPRIDPSLFMERFASQMKLSEKTQVVAATAVRIIQAMTRDWLVTGRRPMGLCGAALLISARFHGVKINAEDMVPIVRMSSSTLNKRLYEWRSTSTAGLTREEFDSTDLQTLPILNGPPCFEAAKRKAVRLKALENGTCNPHGGCAPTGSPQDLSSGDEDFVDEEEDQILCDADNAALQPKRSSAAGNGLDALFGEVEDDATSTEQKTTEGNNSVETEITEDLEEPSSASTSYQSKKPSMEKSSVPPVGSSAEQAVALDAFDSEALGDSFVGGIRLDGIGGDVLCSEAPSAQDINIIAEGVAAALGKHSGVLSKRAGDRLPSATPSTQASTQRTESQDSSPAPPLTFDLDIFESADRPVGGKDSSVLVEQECDPSVDEDRVDETLSDVSDVEQFMLSKNESRRKALIWDEITKEVMPEVHRRLREKKRREKRLALDGESPQGKRKKKLALPEASTPAESVKMALQQKSTRAAKLINNDILEALFE